VWDCINHWAHTRPVISLIFQGGTGQVKRLAADWWRRPSVSSVSVCTLLAHIVYITYCTSARNLSQLRCQPWPSDLQHYLAWTTASCNGLGWRLLSVFVTVLLNGVFQFHDIDFKDWNLVRNRRNKHIGCINGGGSSVSKIDKQSTGVNVLSTTSPYCGICLDDFNLWNLIV